jgi:hypothetical protein
MELEGVDISHLEPSFQFHKLGKPPTILTTNEASSTVVSIPTENIELHTPPIVTITPSYAEPPTIKTTLPHTTEADDSGYESEDTTDISNLIDLSIPEIDDMGGIQFPDRLGACKKYWKDVIKAPQHILTALEEGVDINWLGG